VSHIHIPDGVLPAWLWVSGWALALGLVFAAGRFAERSEVRRKVPLLAVVSALMLVAMSSEIVPLAYHVNLTVVAGVLLGPVLSVIAAFIVEVVLAMLGHGGVTVLGLNTLMIAAEIALGWALFRGFVGLLGRRRVRWAAGVATVLTLATTTTLLVGLVALAGGGGATTRETGALDAQRMTFANPLSGGVFRVGLLSAAKGTAGGPAAGSAAATGTSVAPGTAGAASSGEPAARGTAPLSVGRFAAVVYTLGPIGWLIEALITAWVLGYVARVRPGLLWEGPLESHEHHVPGDEGVR
jgi:ABC-type Co2+ transport system permease subunit